MKDTNYNEYYKVTDGSFTYFINKSTGEKKFTLDKNDNEIVIKLDDFSR